MLATTDQNCSSMICARASVADCTTMPSISAYLVRSESPKPGNRRLGCARGLLAARVGVESGGGLGQRQRAARRDQLDVVDLGVARVVGGIKRAVEAVAAQLGLGDPRRAGAQ